MFFIDLRVTTLWRVLILTPRTKRTAPPAGQLGKWAHTSLCVLCLSISILIKRITWISKLPLISFLQLRSLANFKNVENIQIWGISDCPRCAFSSPSVIWWISADVRPQNRHVKIFVVHSFNRSCLTRHFWLIFYISPCIQIKPPVCAACQASTLGTLIKGGQSLPGGMQGSCSLTSPPSHLLHFRFWRHLVGE